MTRKRKVIETEHNDSTSTNDLSGCGAHFMKNFENKYGYVQHGDREFDNTFEEKQKSYVNNNSACTSSSLGIFESMETDAAVEEIQPEYPSELIEYLANVVGSMKQVDDQNAMVEKCLAECKGFEITLCSFHESCHSIEAIFGSNRNAASQWMNAVMLLDPTAQLRLLYKGSACRTLETLLFALSTTKDAQIISNWVDLVVGEWHDLIFDANASRFIRSLARHIVGKPKALNQAAIHDALLLNSDLNLQKKLAATWAANKVMKKCFVQLSNLAINYESMSAFMDRESVSLLMQDIIECDFDVKRRAGQEMVLQSLKQPSNVLEQWRGRNSSRIWDLLIEKVDDETLQALYEQVLINRLPDFAMHNYANYVLQKFISHAKSDELITKIYNELIEKVHAIFDKGSWSVISTLAQRLQGAQQKELIKRLRKYFGSNKSETRACFVPNVFTLNSAQITRDGDMINFDLKSSKKQGSLLLESLCSLPHNKTVVYSLGAFTPKILLEFANHHLGSYALQAFLKSTHVALNEKQKIAKPLKKEWLQMASGNRSSYVFDSLWDNGVFSIKEKEAMMEAFRKKKERSERLRQICLRIGLNDFMKDRKQWLKEEQRRLNKLP